jgi:hypothetical protein
LDELILLVGGKRADSQPKVERSVKGCKAQHALKKNFVGNVLLPLIQDLHDDVPFWSVLFTNRPRALKMLVARPKS